MENPNPTNRKSYFDGLLESWEVTLEDGTEAVEYIMKTGETPSPVTPFIEGQEYRVKTGHLMIKTEQEAIWESFGQGETCTIPPNTQSIWLKVETGNANYLRVKLS